MKLTIMIAAALAAASGTAFAGSIPYPDVGKENPVVYDFTARNNGDIVAYFFAVDAGYNEILGLEVNGVAQGGWGLQNHSSKYGQPYDFGPVHAGDKLTFVDSIQTTGGDWYSSPVLNSDSAQHVYATAFAGAGIIPAGVYVAFEDLKKGSADFDYNDIQYVYTNVATGAPEPATWAMMGIGFAALGFAAARARRTSAPVA